MYWKFEREREKTMRFSGCFLGNIKKWTFSDM